MDMFTDAGNNLKPRSGQHWGNPSWKLLPEDLWKRSPQKKTVGRISVWMQIAPPSWSFISRRRRSTSRQLGVLSTYRSAAVWWPVSICLGEMSSRTGLTRPYPLNSSKTAGSICHGPTCTGSPPYAGWVYSRRRSNSTSFWMTIWSKTSPAWKRKVREPSGRAIVGNTTESFLVLETGRHWSSRKPLWRPQEADFPLPSRRQSGLTAL